jgi:hypothetical protein
MGVVGVVEVMSWSAVKSVVVSAHPGRKKVGIQAPWVRPSVSASASTESLRSRAVPVVDRWRFPAVNSRDERQTRHAGGWRVGGGSWDMRDPAPPPRELPGGQVGPSRRRHRRRRRHPGGGRDRCVGDRWRAAQHRGRWVCRRRRRRCRERGSKRARPGGDRRCGGRRLRRGRRRRCRRPGRWRGRGRLRSRSHRPVGLGWRRVDEPGDRRRRCDGLGRPAHEGLRQLRRGRWGLRCGRHLRLRLHRQRSVRRSASMLRIGCLPRRLRRIGVRGGGGLRRGGRVSGELRG